ncbi:BrnT family toxin [Variovorax sp. J2P1-59]|uniref:BrnT family toxin n=1 Tax=Variovorax flavidus TaxID=3053501 RepID=UPI002578ECF3|nr:BrnT family toxin [Variovorax sp. J2P1-59]MDM0077275.1 BrnT family toxin [Variovorax sp. J2P1-59]
MLIQFDTAKRDKTLAERGLDFARCGEVFAGPVLTQQDDRAEYGEARFMSFGLLDGRHVVVVWTPRGEARRVISMRNANDREIAKHAQRLG